jgi:hypothetical protein
MEVILMRVIIISTMALAFMLSAFVPHDAQAERATEAEMRLICENWLAYMVCEQGAWDGSNDPKIVDIQEIVQNDTILARCFAISPSGHVVVPILKELLPIKAYSEKYGLDVHQTVGFPQLLREVLTHRIRLFVKTYGSLDATQPPTGDVLLGRNHRQHWAQFLISRDRFDADLREGRMDHLDDAGPLLTTSWHQWQPYKNFCPMGDGGQCLVGCVATAAAQIMKYYEWPHYGVGNHTYWWDGDDSCNPTPVGACSLSADFSDAYDWMHMPDSCDAGCSGEEQRALAELCYEIGVAFEMDYGYCGSGIPSLDPALTVFPNYYRYLDFIDREDRDEHTAETWFDVIKDEIDAGRPMLYAIWATPTSGHAIVCDGWRDTGGMHQYHMNYGWGGPYTGWYSLDSLHNGDPTHEYLIRHISPGCKFVVKPDGSGDFPTIQATIDAALDGSCIIELMDGSFTGDGNRDIDYLGKAITIRSQNRNPEACVIDCQGLGRGFCFQSGELAEAVLDGIKITNGCVAGEPSGGGGGIFCSGSSPTIRNCIISSCLSGEYGGGVYCSGSSPIFTNCTLFGNSAAVGGGVYCVEHSSATFMSCTFSNNSAESLAGGIYCNNSSPAFISSIIAFSSGEGIHFSASSGSQVEHCDMYGNTGAAFSGSVPPRLGQLVTTNANGDSCDQYLNVFLDPLFLDAAASDFHLDDHSPCIGAADPAAAPGSDSDGNPRPNPPGSDPDIGAYEHWLASSPSRLVISMSSNNAVLNWPAFGTTYHVYGTTEPLLQGDLLDTTTDTTWTDMSTSSRPSPYFYYVTAQQ